MCNLLIYITSMKKALLFILIFGICPFFVSAQTFEDLCDDALNGTVTTMMDGTLVMVAMPATMSHLLVKLVGLLMIYWRIKI